MKFTKDVVNAKLLGVYSSKQEYQGDDYFVTEPRGELELNTQGVVGDRHYGYEAISGGRFTSLYKRGTFVRNNRQWSAISSQEVDEISRNLGIEGKLTPELLGINLLIEGVERLSELPPMTYLVFSQHDEFTPRSEGDVVLVVYGQALPCTVAGKALVEPCGDASLEKRFPKGALGLRGTTGWVEKGGVIRPNYSVFILTPTGRD